MGRFLSRPRPYANGPVLAGHVDRNAALIADVARLYIPDDAVVLDMTYGKGRFWNDIENYGWFVVVANDNDLDLWAHYHDDFRYTHFQPETFDIVVLDPPYKSGGGSSHQAMVDTYGLDAIKSTTPSGHGNAGVVRRLYQDGFLEAYRILKPNGLLWFKCQDFVESGTQHWFHIELYRMAQMFGFFPKDLFALVGTKKPMMRHKTQHHARKNLSYLWVMQKSDRGWATKGELEKLAQVRS